MTTPAELVVVLRRRRWRELRITQADLAPRVGVHPSALGRWEQRGREPRLDAFCAWAGEFGFDVVLRPTWIGE